MKQIVCDICGRPCLANNYVLPIIKQIDFRGGRGSQVLMSQSSIARKTMDLCAAHEKLIANIIADIV